MNGDRCFTCRGFAWSLGHFLKWSLGHFLKWSLDHITRLRPACFCGFHFLISTIGSTFFLYRPTLLDVLHQGGVAGQFVGVWPFDAMPIDLDPQARTQPLQGVCDRVP